MGAVGMVVTMMLKPGICATRGRVLAGQWKAYTESPEAGLHNAWARPGGVKGRSVPPTLQACVCVTNSTSYKREV